MNLNDNERKVLTILADEWDIDGLFSYYRFSAIVTQTARRYERALTIKEVRRACRSLTRKGLAQYGRGLFTEDGEVAGSGYAATKAGGAFINPCDFCAAQAAYQYSIRPDGTFSIVGDATTRTVRECEEHYKKSTQQLALTTEGK